MMDWGWRLVKVKHGVLRADVGRPWFTETSTRFWTTQHGDHTSVSTLPFVKGSRQTHPYRRHITTDHIMTETKKIFEIICTPCRNSQPNKSIQDYFIRSSVAS